MPTLPLSVVFPFVRRSGKEFQKYNTERPTFNFVELVYLEGVWALAGGVFRGSCCTFPRFPRNWDGPGPPLGVRR